MTAPRRRVAQTSSVPAGRVTETTVEALTPDRQNRRAHPTRNVEMIAASLRSVGAARSIVIDEHNEVLAGNGVLEAASQTDITKVQVVDVEGDTIVAVRRSGLTDEQKRTLAMYDNRTAELAEWNVEQLQLDAAADLDLQPFFFPDELQKLFGPDAPTEFRTVDVDIETQYRCPSCGYAWSGKSNTAHTDSVPATDTPDTDPE